MAGVAVRFAYKRGEYKTKEPPNSIKAWRILIAGNGHDGML
jgi:hypothetical protein